MNAGDFGQDVVFARRFLAADEAASRYTARTGSLPPDELCREWNAALRGFLDTAWNRPDIPHIKGKPIEMYRRAARWVVGEEQ